MEDESKPTIVDPKPAEIVLRAEPVSDAKPQTIQYNRPRPRPILYLPDLIPWRHVWTAVRILVLLALLGFLITPFLFHQSDMNYSHDRTRADIKILEVTLKGFEIDVGRYPTQAEGLNALAQPPPGVANWHGPYMKAQSTDGWQHLYRYVMPGIHNAGSFDLSSDGRDGKPGTDDDITNW